MNPPGPPGGQNKPSSSSRSKAAPQKPLTEAEKRQMRKAYLNKVAGPMPYTFPPLSSHEITQMPLYSYVESEFESSNTRQAFKDALNEMLKKTDWKKTVSAKSAEYMEQHPEWTIEEIIGASVEDSRRAVPKEVAIELYRMCAEFCRKTLQERYLGREE